MIYTNKSSVYEDNKVLLVRESAECLIGVYVPFKLAQHLDVGINII